MLYLIKGSCEQTILVDEKEITVEVQFKGGALWEGGSLLTFSRAPKYTYTTASGVEIKGTVEKIPPGTKLRFEINDYEQRLKVVEMEGFKCMVQKTL